MDLQQELYRVADELRSIANLGLEYGQNDYDRHRYRRVLASSAKIIAAVEGSAVDLVLRTYADNLSHVCPLLGASAAVFRNGALLLVRRHDNGLWDMPGGAVDVGETLAEAAERELLEETGISGVATRLVGIWDSRIVGARVKAQMFDACFEVQSDGTPSTSPEAIAVGFFGESALPKMSPGADVVVPAVFRLWQLRRSNLVRIQKPQRLRSRLSTVA